MSDRRWNLALFGILIAGVLVRLPTLSQPLVEIHPFRQTQTAYTALLFARDGIDLFHPKVPVLGPPYVLPQEFPAFQAVATLPVLAGMPLDMALRLTGLLCFLATALLLLALVRRLTASRVAALAALVAFLFNPFSLLWSRTATIEYFATAAALGYVLSALPWRFGGAPAWLVPTALLGALAMATKPTTGIMYLLLPFLAGPAVPNLRTLGVGVCAGLAAAAGVSWTAYADAVKASSPFTAALTSAAIAQKYHFFGFDLSPVGEVVRRIHVYLAGGALEVWAPLALWTSARQGPRQLLLLAVAAIGFVFALCGYLLVHEYALIAISPIVAALVGIGVEWIWSRRRTVVVRAFGIGLALTWCISLAATLDYWGRAYASPTPDPEDVLPVAAEIREEVPPSQRIAIEGRDWSPAVLYYADRDGFMITAEHPTPELLAEVRSLGYTRILRCPIYVPRCEQAEATP